MEIVFTGHALEVTEALRQVISKKMEKIQRHFSRIISIHVILTQSKLENLIEAIVQIPGNTFNAKGTADTMYKAIDIMIQKLNRQIAEHRKKMLTQRKEKEIEDV